MKSYSDLIDEDYPSSWNKEEFKNISSFQGKLTYANTRLQKIASGSGRAVFKIDDQKALKIAKNKKGLAQNNIESEKYIQNYDITAHTYDIGEEVKGIGPFWVEMELARRVSPSKFKEITGVDYKAFRGYITHLALKNYDRAKHPLYRPAQYPNEKELENNEFVQDVLRLAMDYDMGYGDLGRLSSYGIVLRDGKEKVVLVDYGLTKQLHDDYYKVG